MRPNVSVGLSVRRLAGVAAAAALGLGMLLTPALADAGFERWIASFRKTAAENGISRSTYDRAFRGVDSVDPEVLEKAKYQPEFTAPVWDYFDNRVHEQSVATGRAMDVDRVGGHSGEGGSGDATGTGPTGTPGPSTRKRVPLA